MSTRFLTNFWNVSEECNQSSTTSRWGYVWALVTFVARSSMKLTSYLLPFLLRSVRLAYFYLITAFPPHDVGSFKQAQSKIMKKLKNIYIYISHQTPRTRSRKQIKFHFILINFIISFYTAIIILKFIIFWKLQK